LIYVGQTTIVLDFNIAVGGNMCRRVDGMEPNSSWLDFAVQDQAGQLTRFVFEFVSQVTREQIIWVLLALCQLPRVHSAKYISNLMMHVF
jgi:hypothetical protein